MNPAKRFVEALADRSPFHRYIANHGQVVDSPTQRTTVDGIEVRLSESVSPEERSLIGEVVRQTPIGMKECYGNALKMWQYNHRFKYTEGFAGLPEDTEMGHQHAWCMLDGEKLVDVTPEFDSHYGVILDSDSLLEQYTEPDVDYAGIIGNRSDDYTFLKERGYIE